MALAAAPSTSTKLYFPLALLACFILLTQASSHGFTADLIHRDSPLSPLYNSSMSHLDRLHNAFRRSVTRVHHFIKPTMTSLSSSSAAPNIQSSIIPSAGEYLMNVSIGTPPVEVLGIADTGSDLIWTQCKPCKQCFNQNPPLFDPKKSSTYHSIPCQSSSCTYLEEAACGTLINGDHDTCEYSYRYGDRSFTRGTLALETLTVGSTSGRPTSVPKVVFGCGHENGGTFDESGSGLIGLGGGPLSLISQLMKLTNGGKFSYCLVPTVNTAASKITFGSVGVVSGSGAVSTPLVAKNPDTFYYLTLEAISVGEKRLAYKTKSPDCEEAAVAANEGNIIIDSGTTLTLLPPGFHDDLVSALETAINAERVSDPRGILSLCFKSKSDDIGVPVITAHFSGGADVKLQALNTFARMDDDMICFTMIPSSDVAIFGNLAQMNFLVGYDLEERSVSFKPTDCTKH
ncbi:PREDICTED: aspartic proteinase CDR1 [Prunus mume]|uniref:Aspartic proteinase CDR1 n=1 Tax=Prunus mume TaxID=102107 RepID=A0ABM0PDK6_PRUMU|nr:PREDICTED: aspartic proteinase CDR1 [Prunus mume]